jgi:hypothetical protein
MTGTLGTPTDGSKLAANGIPGTEIRARSNRIWRTDTPRGLFSFLFKSGAYVRGRPRRDQWHSESGSIRKRTCRISCCFFLLRNMPSEVLKFLPELEKFLVCAVLLWENRRNAQFNGLSPLRNQLRGMIRAAIIQPIVPYGMCLRP